MRSFDLRIRTVTDLKGVQQLKTQLKELSAILNKPDHMLVGTALEKDIQKSLNAVRVLDKTLDSAFDVNLGSININKFNNLLKKSGMSVNTLYRDLSRLGPQGHKAFLGMTQSVLQMGNSIQRTNAVLNNMKTTLKNTVTWGISSSMFNSLTSSVQKAFSYVKSLDKDLNDIRVVTGKSADQMERFAREANRAAKDLAVSTREYTQGALIYYQQGLSDEEVAARTNVTAKAANVTGQDMSTVSEQLTAVWNGYQVANEAAKEGMQVYELYVDKISAVGATTASNLEEQATAMSKVASAAASMGVGFDQLNAQIATIVSVTRQAPESVGTALKTIYARLGDLKVDGVDEFGTKLGAVSSQLQVMGIDVVDSNGEMREMGQVMTEVAEKWGTWTSAQRQAAAVAMAGKRQYNNLIALFDNWDMYGEALTTSMNAAGTLTKQQNISLDSLEKKMEKLTATTEKFYDALFNESAMGGFIDGLTTVIDFVGSLTQGLGGLTSILPMVAGLLLKTFNKDIGKGIASGLINLKTSTLEETNDRARIAMSAKFKDISYLNKADLEKKANEDEEKIKQEQEKNKEQENKKDKQEQENKDKQEELKNYDKLMKQEQDTNIKYYQDIMKYKNQMSEDDLERVQNLIHESNLISQQKIDLQEQIDLSKQNKKISKANANEISNILLEGEQEKREKDIAKLYKNAVSVSATIKNIQEQEPTSTKTEAEQNAEKEKNRLIKLHYLTEQEKQEITEELQQKAEEKKALENKLKNDALSEEQKQELNQELEETKKRIKELQDLDRKANEGRIVQNEEEREKQGRILEEKAKDLLNRNPDLTDKALEKILYEQFKQENGKSDYTHKELEEYFKLLRKAGEEENERIEIYGKNIEAMLEEQLEKSLEDDSTIKVEDVMSEYEDEVKKAMENGAEGAAAYNQALEALSERYSGLIDQATLLNEINTRERDNEEERENILEEEKIASFMSNVTDIAGGFTTIVGAVNGFKSAIQAAGDTSLTEMERIKASMGGMITSTIALTQGLYTLIPAFIATATAVKDGTLAKIRDTIVTKGAAVTEGLYSGVLKGTIIQKRVDKLATKMQTLAKKEDTVATNEQTAANYRFYASCVILLVIMVALMAIFAGITAAINTATKKLEANATAAEDNLEAQKALTEAYREQKTALDELTTKYEELMQQEEDGIISKAELRDKTYDLCLQYEQESLAIKALTSDYEELYKIIKDAQRSADANLAASLKQESEARFSYITSKHAADEGGASTFTETKNGEIILDIDDYWDHTFSSSLVGRLAGLGKAAFTGDAELTKAGGDWEAAQLNELTNILDKYNITVDETGHINSKEFFTQAALYYDDLLVDLSNSTSDEALKLVDALTKQEDALKENSEVLKELRDLRIKEQLGNSYSSEVSDKEVKSVSDYNKEVDRLTKELIEKNKSIENDEDKLFISTADTSYGKAADIENQAEKAAKAFLREFENASLWSKNAVIVEELQKFRGENTGNFSTEKLSEQFDSFSNAEIEFITSNINLAASYDSLEEFISHFSEQIKLLNAQDFQVQIKTVLDDDSITSKEIEEIYDNFEDFEIKTGYKQKDFELLNYNRQRTIMMEYFIAEQQYAIQNKDVIVKGYEEEKEKYIQNNEEKYNIAKQQTEKFYEENKAIFDKLGMSQSGFDAGMASLDANNFRERDFSALKNFDSYQDAIDEYGVLDISAEQFNLLHEAVKEVNPNFEEFIGLIEEYDKIKKYEAVLDDLQNAIDDANSATIDYVGNQKILEQAEKDATTAIKDLKSGYDDLKGVIEQYNKDGFLTIENALKIAEMDPTMLAALEWDTENKTMSINTEVLKANLLMRIEEAKAAVILQGQNKLLALSIEDVTIQREIDQIMANSQNETMAETINRTKQEAAEYQKLAAVMRGSVKGADEIIDGVEDQLKALDELGTGLKDNFSNIMNGIVDPDDLKKIEEEVDRYWEINHILAEIEETMSDLERIQKKLHGKELIDSLKQENKLIAEQSKAYEQLREEQIEEAGELREKLSHMGVSFYEEDGSIANYEEAMTNAVKRYNSIISNSNFTEASKEQAEKDYKNIKKWIDRYDELVTKEIKDTEDKIEENRLEILDNNLEAWETELEIKLDTTQAERDWNEFLNDITTDFTQHFEDIGKTFNLAKDNFNTYIRENGDFGVNKQAIEDVIAEMKKLEAGEESAQFATMSDAKEKLKELWKQTRDNATDTKDAYQDMWDTYLDGISQAQDKFDEFIEQYNTINEHLETEKELIELIYGEEAYDRIGNVLRAENEATAAQMRSQKERVDQLYELMMQEEEGSEARQKYYEQWIEAQSELNNLTTEYVNELKNIYSNEIKKILKDFETAVTKGSSFDDLAEEWERVQKKSDKYFDNVEKIYEVQKLSNTIQGSIDSATDIKNQQKLQDLHDREIEYLRDKEKLTQYDLDAANARYEIALKEIALEEAQNSKNAMKLTRGADGNWSYQYVADGDEIATKQQELSDAYNNLYQLADSAHKENINEALDLLAWYKEQADKIANDFTIAEEEKNKKLLELEQQFKESLNNLTLESETYRRDQAVSTGLMLKDSYEQDADNYKIMTNEEKDLCDKMKEVAIGNYDEIWDKTSGLYQYIENDANNALLGNTETWDSLGQKVLDYWAQDGGQSISKHIEDSINSIMIAYDSYQIKVDEGLSKTGRDVRSLGTDYDDLTTSINGVETAISNLISQTTPELQGYSDTIRKMKKPFEDLKLEVQNVQIEVEKALKMLGSFNPDDYDFDINKGNKSEYDNGGQDGGDSLGSSSEDAQSLKAEDFNIYNEGGYRQYDVKGDMEYTKDDKGHEIKTTRNGKTLYEVSVNGTKFYTDKEKYEGQATIPPKEKSSMIYQDAEGIALQPMPDVNKISYYKVEQADKYQDYPVQVKSDIPGTSTIGYISFDNALSWGILSQQQIDKIKSSSTRNTPTRFATGGYTGAWGSEGKLAVLHEKELVLNKADTENILNTVSMVRSLEQGLLGKIAGMLADLSNLSNNGYISNSTKNSSQSNNSVFNITAEFPNANDVTSIKEAILSLPNIVSQHIAERKR